MRAYCLERRVFKITDRGEQGYLSLQAKILSPQLTVIERKEKLSVHLSGGGLNEENEL